MHLIATYFKKDIYYAFFLYILFFLLLLLSEPVELSFIESSKLTNAYIRDIIEKFIVLIVFGYSIFYTKRFHLLNKLLIHKIENLYLYKGPLLIILLLLYFNFQSISELKFSLSLVFIFSSILAALSEEILFRGILLTVFIETFKKHKIGLIVIFNSLIFGLSHFVNLVSYSLSSVITQSIGAICIGVYFSGLFLRTKCILLIGLLHGMLNYTSELSHLNNLNTDYVQERELSDVINSLLVFTVIYGSIFFIGLRMASKSTSSIKKLF
ncbi:MAG: CPBP family intramembrane glutamic endopeptidase [Candidatus Cyclobacteriaceae bacterium M3_2C_046]